MCVCANHFARWPKTRSQAVARIADRAASQHLCGHVTSSVTWLFDPPRVISYWWSFTESLSPAVLAVRNGRAYATGLRPSQLSSVCTECIVLNGASESKSYYWQPMGSRIYEKSIGIQMNDLDLCLHVVSRLRQPLRHIWRWISR